MRINIHHYHYPADESEIVSILKRLEIRSNEIMINLDRVTSEVEELTSVVQSAELLLADLSQRLRDNAGNQAAIEELADKLDEQGSKLAAAVAANTPASGEVPPQE